MDGMNCATPPRHKFPVPKHIVVAFAAKLDTGVPSNHYLNFLEARKRFP